ncbi:aspartic proteinase nepenthesin-1-like [Rhododendron vialii]|uniref:aspartic proteinase nepenthesin-1-like n=1 Tax=Rhododendron vialii TaxID=182163 RepID=UPI00265EBEF6|nr:aspartic proteinase nepenthesin-1-like [Rhododendron vialii]
MASLPPSLSSLLFLTLTLILISISPAFSTPRQALDDHQDQLMKTGFKITLNHIDSGGNFTNSERLYRAVKRSSQRRQKFNEIVLTAKHPKLKTTVYAGVGEYVMNFSIGTPPKSYYGIMDTGSNLIWTQCQPCLYCVPQPVPLFDPKKSSTFSNVSCSSKLCLDLQYSDCNPFYGCVYIYRYESGVTSGFLGTETFTFEKVKVPKVTFGCGLFNLGAGFTEGLIGLGRGPLSLVSQLGEPTFSYCLTSWNGSKPSTLLIGSHASVNSSGGGGEIKTTPLIQNRKQPTFYYLSLEGITIGSTRLPVNKTTFALHADGSGGLIIDSGTTITQLAESAYILVLQEFISQVKPPPVDARNSTGLDLCFELPSDPSDRVEIPPLVFHFKDADLDLPKENYMITNSSLGVTCLAMGVSGDTLSIFGNIQQQNILVVYDLYKETLSFMLTECDKF